MLAVTALVAIGKVIGPGIASSLIAKAAEKGVAEAWRSKEENLEERIEKAFQNGLKGGFEDFVRAFPKGEALSEMDILKKFLVSPTLRKELEKITLTEYEIPNFRALRAAFGRAGYRRKMLPVFDFKVAIAAFIDRFREELADVIEYRVDVEKGDLDVYMEQVAEYCGQLDFVGIPDPKQKKDLQLEDIFITLRARERRPEGDVLPEEDGEEEETDLRRMREMGQPRESAPVKLNDALRDNRKLAILGGPGAGKTTMLRYVALMLAKGQADEIGLPDGLIPIFVELNRFASRDEQQQPLLDFACGYADRHMSVKLPPNFFESYLQQGRCVVLLDGLDEVATLRQRKDVKDKVALFASRHSGNTFVDRKSTRLNSSHIPLSRMPSSA